VDAVRISELLADHLDAVVPDGIRVRAVNGMLWYSADRVGVRSGSAGSYIEANLHNGDSDEERLARCCEMVLSQLQDFVDEATAEPWPGGLRPPKPRAEVRDGLLRLWWEDEENVVVEWQPIDIRDLGLAD